MTIELEDRLRSHYASQASALPLDNVDFESLVVHGVSRQIHRHDQHTTARRTPWVLAAACLVGVAGVGATVVATTRHRSTPEGVRSPVSSSEPGSRPTAAGGARSCATTEVTLPATVAPTSVAAEPAASSPRSALVPAEVPSGFCVASAGATAFDAPTRRTVWASCSDCDTPSAAVELIRLSETPSNISGGSEVRFSGRTARFEQGDARSPSTLTSTGGAPAFTFVGWGISKDTFIALAKSYIDGNDVPSVDGLELLSDGEGSAVSSAMVSADSTVNIAFSSVDGEGQGILAYGYWTGKPVSNLLAAAWSLPNSRIITIDGTRALVSESKTWTMLIRQLDARTVVSFNSYSEGKNPPLTIEQLAAIQLTTASTDGPLWRRYGLT